MNDVVQLVESRLESSHLADEAKLLVLAALEGDAALADIAGLQNPTGVRTSSVKPSGESGGAFLSRIKVQGFRGIGPETELSLTPGPGLTVVAGRNGSGKSSLVEGLEVALTGTTYRWLNKRSKQWREAWKNIHYTALPRIEITLAEECVGPTRITVEWPKDADLTDIVTSVQRHGEKKQVGIDALGWSTAIETFRPLLTYDELGALLASEPSKLYDAIATVLGLDQLADAIKRLEERSKALASPGLHLTRAKRELIEHLESIADERAHHALCLLRPSLPDGVALRAVATGVTQQVSESWSHLHAILQLSLPTENEVAAAAERLKLAVATLASVGSTASDALERRTAVLVAAQVAHAHDGNMSCPVCGTGTLDDDRAEHLRQEIEDASKVLGALRSARKEMAEARAAAIMLIAHPPRNSSIPLPRSLEELRADTVTAWSHWTAVPDDDLDLADQLVLQRQQVGTALARLQDAVRAELTARDNVWTGVATRLATFADNLEAWRSRKPEADHAQAALKWLKNNDLVLRNDKLRPIAEKAAEIWADLRQESNVDITGLTLEGAATRRHLEISASVDGTVAPGGLAVLSQGELHALALALFLPRATLPESPFRFVVLDDPVQAMDPAKIDGLVDVLIKIAKNHQVVVFSHDDRLPAAVRRCAVNATVFEVTRLSSSVVVLHKTVDPAERYLGDAFGMVKDHGLPDVTLRKLLPGMLRFAVEAAARDRYFSARLQAGHSHTQVETDWTAAHRTGQRVSLALYGKVTSLDGWLSKKVHRKQALGICSSGMHAALNGDPLAACRSVEMLLADIRTGTK